jgi:hypothetical protein
MLQDRLVLHGLHVYRSTSSSHPDIQSTSFLNGFPSVAWSRPFYGDPPSGCLEIPDDITVGTQENQSHIQKEQCRYEIQEHLAGNKPLNYAPDQSEALIDESKELRKQTPEENDVKYIAANRIDIFLTAHSRSSICFIVAERSIFCPKIICSFCFAKFCSPDVDQESTGNNTRWFAILEPSWNEDTGYRSSKSMREREGCSNERDIGQFLERAWQNM